VQSKAKSSIESELNELNNITFLKISEHVIYVKGFEVYNSGIVQHKNIKV